MVFDYKLSLCFKDKNMNLEDNKFEDDKNRFNPINLVTHPTPALPPNWDGCRRRVSYLL